MTAFSSTVDTQIGPFTAIVDGDGAVLASGWTDTVGDLLAVIHRSLRPASAVDRPDLGDVTKAVIAYHDGDLTAIDTVEVRQVGGPFIAHAWQVLRTVEAGAPITYTAYAALAGNAPAVRAAAMACASNAAALFVPCHRVLRTDGTLGGFRWGLDVKRALIAHETRAA